MTSRNPLGNNSPNQRSTASSPDTETRKARTVKKPITSNKDDFMLQEQDIVPIMDNPQRQQLTTQRSIKKPIPDSIISRPSLSNNSPSNGTYSNVNMNDSSSSYSSRNNTPDATAVPRVRSIKNSKSSRKAEQLEMFDDDDLPPPPSTPPPPSNYSPSRSTNKKNQRQTQSNRDEEEEQPGELCYTWTLAIASLLHPSFIIHPI